MKLTLKHAFAIIILSFAAPAAAGPLEDATAANERGDYATALRLVRPLAAQGNDRAQFNLGVMYDKGRGVPQNDAEALKWYRKAAEQGYPIAQYNLGVMYVEGQGVPQNDVEAVQWFRRAAEQDYAVAQYNLGVMYDNGRGMAQNEAEE